MKTETMNFEALIGRINQVQDMLQAQATTAKLQSLNNQKVEIWQAATAN